MRSVLRLSSQGGRTSGDANGTGDGMRRESERKEREERKKRKKKDSEVEKETNARPHSTLGRIYTKNTAMDAAKRKRESQTYIVSCTNKVNR